MAVGRLRRVFAWIVRALFAAMPTRVAPAFTTTIDNEADQPSAEAGSPVERWQPPDSAEPRLLHDVLDHGVALEEMARKPIESRAVLPIDLAKGALVSIGQKAVNESALFVCGCHSTHPYVSEPSIEKGCMRRGRRSPGRQRATESCSLRDLAFPRAFRVSLSPLLQSMQPSPLRRTIIQ